MKLRYVHTTGLFGVPDGAWAFSAVDAGQTEPRTKDLIVVTGPEGSGKTRFLEAIASARELLAPSGDRFDEDDWVREGNRSAKVVLGFELSEKERAEIGSEARELPAEVIFRADPDWVAPDQTDPGLLYLLERYDHDPAVSKLEYFGENRRLDVGGGEMSLGRDRQHEFRTGKSPRKFAFLPPFLRSLRSDSLASERFARILEALGDSVRWDDDGRLLVTRSRKVTDLATLSASEADTLLFAATFCLVRLSSSIVLVDRPELYRPAVERFVQGLREAGDGNQLIVASTHPALTKAAPDRVVIRFDERTPTSPSAP
jgi:predicted ATPase